jgi:hypothetical protein
MSTSRYPTLVALLTLAAVFACGRGARAADDLASVSGTITLDGKPLTSGRIFFHLGGGQFVGAKTKEDGTFKMERVPAGTYKVTVEASVGAKAVVPARYSAEDKSEIQVEVKKGDNTIDIKLASR